jgi:glycosyltransferase involved in cell wall biosynthesis
VAKSETREKKTKSISFRSILEEQSQQYLEDNILSEQVRDKKISLVACIPAFNEERLIAHIILEAQKHVDLVLVCDDGSSDNTSEISKSVGALVIENEKNIGKGAAAKHALKSALKLDADYIIMLDGDGQHDPGEIPQLIEPLIKGEADLVIGSRYVEGSRSEAPLYRRIGLRIIEKLSKQYINEDVRDSQSGFRSFSHEALSKIINTKSNGFGLESEQLLLASQNGLKILEVPVNIRYEGLGITSTKHPIIHGIEIVVNILRLVVEKNPMEILGIPGIVSLFLGAIMFSMFLHYFNVSRYFSFPLALLSTFALIFGALLTMSAFLFYAVKRLKK